MSDINFELWTGSVHRDGEDMVAIVVCQVGVPGLMVVSPDWITPLIDESSGDPEECVLAITMTLQHARNTDSLTPLEWRDILDRKVLAEWSVEEEHLASIMHEFYEEHPEQRPVKPTLH